MEQIQWKLREYLASHNLAALTVEQEAGIAQNNIYRLLQGDGPSRLDRFTLARIITALRNLTGQAVTVADLLEYQPDDDAGFSAAEETAAIQADAEMMQRIARYQAGKAQFIPWKDAKKLLAGNDEL
jgi:DNA-binding Xre family transcriptional regulator